MKAITRSEFDNLLRVSRVRSRLKRELRFVPEEITDWEIRDFLVVMNRSQAEGVLAAPRGQMMIMPFRLSKRMPNQSGRIEAIICDFCATWQSGTHSQILTFELQSKSVSYLVCGDLNCSLHVRDKTAAAKRSRTQLRETMSTEARIGRLKNRLESIVTSIETAS